MVTLLNYLAGILEISKTMDKLEMPLVVVEEVDSSVTVHTLLLGQYETLTKVTNNIIMVTDIMPIRCLSSVRSNVVHIHLLVNDP